VVRHHKKQLPLFSRCFEKRFIFSKTPLQSLRQLQTKKATMISY
jgi:hypothetical protein